MFNHNSKRFGSYPSCDHLNYALDMLLRNSQENQVAIEEICWAIFKANGYFYEHVQDKLNQQGIWKRFDNTKGVRRR